MENAPLNKTNEQEPSIDMEAFWTEMEALIAPRKKEEEDNEAFVKKIAEENPGSDEWDLKQKIRKEREKLNLQPLDMIELAKIEEPRKNLTKADAIMWQKVKDFSTGAISQSEINLPLYIEDIRNSGAILPRTSFLQVIVNLIQRKAEHFK